MSEIPNFIALDGEGITRAKSDDERAGKHDYILLASSSKNEIHCTDDGGLSTSQCLDFILDEAERGLIPKSRNVRANGGRANWPTKYNHSVLVGFYTNYDVNMILRDLQEHELARLRVEGMVTFRATDNHKCYRIKYLPNRLMTISEGYWMPIGVHSKKKAAQRGREWRTIRVARWWDCSRFFQSSFVAALRSWKIGRDNEVNQIEEMKNQRNVFRENELDAITKYCYRECDLLVQLMDKLAALLADCGISISSWYGAGSVASAIMKENGVKELLEDYPDVEPAILASYFGGRIETFGIGYQQRATYQYDIRSAYPAACLELPNLQGGAWEHFDGYQRGKHTLYRVEWEPNIDASKNKFFTPFPYRSKGHVLWPTKGNGWYHGIEVEAAKQSGYAIRVLETWRFRPKRGTELGLNWIRNIYALRQHYREAGDERERVLKYPLNSIYGKFAQSTDSNYAPPFQNYYYAGFITAWCRAKMMGVMSQFNDGEVLTIATDGIITTREAELKLGNDIGEFECKAVEAGLLVVQAGVYCTPIDIRRSRGFSSRQMLYANLCQLWHESKIGGIYEVQETKFIGYGLALGLTDGITKYWRRWLPATKRIKFGANGTKAPNWNDLIDSDWIRLLPPIDVDGPNEPYNPAAPELKNLRMLMDEMGGNDDWLDSSEWEIAGQTIT